MTFKLTVQQIAQIEIAIASLDAVSTLCSRLPLDDGMEGISGDSFASLLDLINGQLREGVNVSR